MSHGLRRDGAEPNDQKSNQDIISKKLHGPDSLRTNNDNFHGDLHKDGRVKQELHNVNNWRIGIPRHTNCDNNKGTEEKYEEVYEQSSPSGVNELEETNEENRLDDLWRNNIQEMTFHL